MSGGITVAMPRENSSDFLYRHPLPTKPKPKAGLSKFSEAACVTQLKGLQGPLLPMAAQ